MGWGEKHNLGHVTSLHPHPRPSPSQGEGKDGQAWIPKTEWSCGPASCVDRAGPVLDHWHRPCANVSGHFADDLRDTQFGARTHGIRINMRIVTLQQPEWDALRLPGDTQKRFPRFELARHHFANPVPTQEGFFQAPVVLQTLLRKLRGRNLGKIQAQRRAHRGYLPLRQSVQGEQTLDRHIEPVSVLAQLFLRCHANRIAFDVEPVLRR